ncbi:MAG TPA: DHA2 family efflux MFS transporter permease subunit, partial [Thermodesulfobacteriota bacterium]|nr:DHA2 family efflux MFS transporter permease subunit [Thermodesulfobacteriota bacterium]
LQVVLDKGQREDWFSSTFIIWMSFIAFSSLSFLIVNELFSANPVVNLRIFRNRTFSAANLVMFFAFFNLFGSIVLLPIYLQTLMGYTSYLAGLVLGPGGVATMVAMPIAGQLITRMNPKFLLAFGITVGSYSIYLMSKFNLQADFEAIIIPRIVLGIGMGFLFIPLNTMAMSRIPREEMGNATGLFNLLRNLGGSFGVAFVTTLLARRAQFHQARLVEHMTPLDRNFQFALPQVSGNLQERGLDPGLLTQGTPGAIYHQLLQQASMLSFNDVFFLLSVLMILILPLVFFMRMGTSTGPPVVH